MRQGWLILIVIVLLGLSVWSALTREPTYGLDVKGGYRVILQADLSKLKPEERNLWPEKRQTVREILEKRLKGPFGAADATVATKGMDQFTVEIPGVTNPDEVSEILSKTARLEFWHALNVQTDRDPNRPYKAEPSETAEGAEVWSFRDTTAPEEDETAVIKSGTPEFKQMIAEEWELILDGSMLRRAKSESTGVGSFYVALDFNREGTERLAEFSRKVEGRNEYLAIVLDGEVISFPVMRAVITDGKAVIEGGNMTGKEAIRLATLLQAGALPVDLTQVYMQRVEPTIGSQALDMIVRAGFVGFALVSLFMMLYYLVPGILAVVALLCYALFCYAVYVSMGVTFSLPGIAGFLLSIGMAVDANVLIFERMKEELRAGKTLLAAIDAGFKRAFPAILDSNVCTIITCIVLYNLGTGPVKGFAATLGVGVAISLFTAITLTRMLLYLLVGAGVSKPSLFALGRQWFGRENMRVISRMAVYFTISGAILVPGIAFIVMGGLKPNIEFGSGTEVIYTVPGGVKETNRQIQQRLAAAGLEGASVQLASGGKQVIIRMRELKEYRVLDNMTQLQQREKLASVLAPAGVDARLIEVKEKNPDGTETVVQKPASEESFSQVGKIISDETIRNAILALVISIALILLYLSVRFAIEGGWSGVKFGTAALIATIHDVGVLVGCSAIFGYFLNWEISSLFITALLTIIGFSVHDTIVIFDRIRENLLHKKRGETFESLVDRSISQSFARSINTSLTVVLMLAALFFIGSAMPDLRHFHAIMLIGVISGTYSSIFNASPILVLIERFSHRMGAQTLEAAVKERERAVPAAPRTAAATSDGDSAFGQTGRVTPEPAKPPHGTDEKPSARPKSKKPKRRF